MQSVQSRQLEFGRCQNRNLAFVVGQAAVARLQIPLLSLLHNFGAVFGMSIFWDIMSATTLTLKYSICR